eukprot:3119641-Rhodomonas_salina.1
MPGTERAVQTVLYLPTRATVLSPRTGAEIVFEERNPDLFMYVLEHLEHGEVHAPPPSPRDQRDPRDPRNVTTVLERERDLSVTLTVT